MKVTAPADLHGRMIRVETRLKMLNQSFEALASAYDDVGAPSADAIQGFADVAEELADEVGAIQEAYITESNEAIAGSRFSCLGDSCGGLIPPPPQASNCRVKNDFLASQASLAMRMYLQAALGVPSTP